MEIGLYKIRSLAQVHEELIRSKKSLKEALDSIDFSLLDSANPLYTSVCGKSSIESVLESIPSEEVLSNMVSIATKQQKQDSIIHYTGDYKLVRELQMHLEDAKPEAVDAYYMLTQVKPIHLGSAEQYLKDNSQLHSWKIYGEQQKTAKFERNALHDKYRDELKAKEKASVEQIPERFLLQQDDLIIHLTLYDSHIKQKQNEFICHGRQLLSQIKDSFYCLIEEMDNIRNKRGGSFICIDNIFYNDLRDRKQDLSKDIIAYAEKKKQDSGNFISLPMEKTRIEELRVEVGQPYVYRHLEGCDHMLVFNQIRLMDPSIDLRDSRSYPVNIYQKRLKRRRCDGCERAFASLIVLDDRMKNGEHGYYCDRCHLALNINTDGEPKYKGMMVIRYFHD